jgi:hypothetical protein
VEEVDGRDIQDFRFAHEDDADVDFTVGLGEVERHGGGGVLQQIFLILTLLEMGMKIQRKLNGCGVVVVLRMVLLLYMARKRVNVYSFQLPWRARCFGHAARPSRANLLMVKPVVAQSCVKELRCLRTLGGGREVRFVPCECRVGSDRVLVPCRRQTPVGRIANKSASLKCYAYSWTQEYLKNTVCGLAHTSASIVAVDCDRSVVFLYR